MGTSNNKLMDIDLNLRIHIKVINASGSNPFSVTGYFEEATTAVNNFIESQEAKKVDTGGYKIEVHQ